MPSNRAHKTTADGDGGLSLRDAAGRAGVTPPTLRRWARQGQNTLPEDARVIKTIGDEAMIVASDAEALTDWAVGFQQLYASPARPRIGIHCGDALYRDGDYYGRDVNIASRVAARSAGGEVLVTRPVVDRSGSHLTFERIAEVRLKGFTESTKLFLARQRSEADG